MPEGPIDYDKLRKVTRGEVDALRTDLVQLRIRARHKLCPPFDGMGGDGLVGRAQFLKQSMPKEFNAHL